MFSICVVFVRCGFVCLSVVSVNVMIIGRLSIVCLSIILFCVNSSLKLFSGFCCESSRYSSSLISIVGNDSDVCVSIISVWCFIKWCMVMR